jgi:hypothetical protein
LKDEIVNVSSSLFLKSELEIENVKKHIKLVNNYPVVDKDWLAKLFSAAIANALNGPPKKITLLETLTIVENLRRTSVNFKYQGIFKEFLDRVDAKIEEMDSKVKAIDDETLRLNVINSVLNQLFDEFTNIDYNYNSEYENSFLKKVTKFFQEVVYGHF